jgi:hypothetical protein
MPGERCPIIDEIVTGLELLAAQAEAALKAAHQDVATAEVILLQAMNLAPETPATQRTIIQLALRDLLEKHACQGKSRRKAVSGDTIRGYAPVSPEQSEPWVPSQIFTFHRI